MAAVGITAMGLTGVVRMNWVQDDLDHVLEHAHTDETPGMWTGRACPEYGLALGGDVDDATLRRLAASFEHHCGPHGLPSPHIHNIVVVALTRGA